MSLFSRNIRKLKKSREKKIKKLGFVKIENIQPKQSSN